MFGMIYLIANKLNGEVNKDEEIIILNEKAYTFQG